MIVFVRLVFWCFFVLFSSILDSAFKLADKLDLYTYEKSVVFYFTSFRLAISLWTKLIYPVELHRDRKLLFFIWLWMMHKFKKLWWLIWSMSMNAWSFGLGSMFSLLNNTVYYPRKLWIYIEVCTRSDENWQKIPFVHLKCY